MLTAPRNLLRRLGADEKGLAAIEFALIAPIMIFFYLAMVEVCQAFMAQKRAGHVTSLVADLVAQEDRVSGASIDDVFAIGGLMMRPFSEANLTQRVTSVTRVGGSNRVDWSHGHGMAARNAGSTMTLPNNLIVDGQSLVVSEAVYDYESPVDYLMPGVTQFSQVYYLRPRVVDQVTCTDC